MQLLELVNHVREQLKGVAAQVMLDVALAGDGSVALNESRTVCRVNFTVRVETPNAEVSDRRAHGNENTTGANGGSLH